LSAANAHNGPVNQAQLAAEQIVAVEAINKAIAKRAHFTLQGLAGTGKTTVAGHIARSQDGALLCAPTGKAASVLCAKTGLPAMTVHSAFYEFVSAEDRDGASRLVFRPAHSPGSLRGNVLVLDECSMISREVARDILATGITIISIGDPGQLPPVNGAPFFTAASVTLTQIHRQALGNPIIRQAHRVRGGGRYAPDGAAFRVGDKLSKADLLTADIVLTWKRSTRSRINAAARRVRGLTSPLPVEGEPLVCLRNMHRSGLYNGAIYRASRDVAEGDDKIGITTEAGDIEVHADFLPPEREDATLDLPPGGWKTAFAFGYALTVHKAQGSEFDKVVLVDEYTRREDRVAWLYTAITRAKKQILVLPTRS
jgi:exodeoxyribonuclease-5